MYSKNTQLILYIQQKKIVIITQVFKDNIKLK